MEPKEILKMLILEDEELKPYLGLERYQASGKGGQKRNRVYSAVRLTFKPLQIQVSASENREANINLKSACHKMRMALARHLVETPTHEFEELQWPIGEKWRANISLQHRFFPLHLAWAHLWVRHFDGEVKYCASYLNISSSALVRFLKKDSWGWNRIQKFREHKGLHPLK